MKIQQSDAFQQFDELLNAKLDKSAESTRTAKNS
jgi:hypothetical protein